MTRAIAGGVLLAGGIGARARGRVHRRVVRAGRARRAGDDRRRRRVRSGRGAAGEPGDRRTPPPPARGHRLAGPPQRDAQPASHGGHRDGADGRRRRRDAVHGVRGVDQGVGRRHGRRIGRRRARDQRRQLRRRRAQPAARDSTSRTLPEVDHALGIGTGAALVDGDSKQIAVLDPENVAGALDIDVVRRQHHGARHRNRSRSRSRWPTTTTGISARPLPVTFADGTTEDLTIGALYGSSALVGNYVMPQATWAAHATQAVDQAVIVALRRRCLGGGRPRRGRAGRRGLRRSRRDDAHRVHRRHDGQHRCRARPHLRDARTGDHHRPDGHREHAGARGLRADERARHPAGGRHDAAAGAGDGALGGGDRRGVRHARRHRRRRVPRLGPVPPRQRGRQASTPSPSRPRSSWSSSSSARSPACSPACARPGAPRSSTCCKRSPRPEPNVGSIEDEDGGLARHTLQRHRRVAHRTGRCRAGRGPG